MMEDAKPLERADESDRVWPGDAPPDVRFVAALTLAAEKTEGAATVREAVERIYDQLAAIRMQKANWRPRTT